MNIKYRQLKAFVLAARLPSFNAAAAEMSITPASFSNLIQELENDIGLQLFDREGRRCTLTMMGRDFRDRISAAIEHLESTYEDLLAAGRGQHGRLTIATLPSISSWLVPRVLVHFRTAFPSVEIVLRELTNDEVIAAVQSQGVELGLASRLQDSKRFVYEPMATDRIMVAVPSGHRLASGSRAVSWKTLERESYILVSSGYAEYVLRSGQVTLTPSFTVGTIATAIEMVRNGMGITALPSSVAPVLNMDGTQCLPIHGPFGSRTLGVAYQSASSLSRVAQCFLAMLRSFLESDAPSQRGLTPARNNAG